MVKFLILTISIFLSTIVWANPHRKTINSLLPVSYLLYNIDKNQYITSSNENVVRPIASITKLMSAIVTLRKNLDLDEVLTVTGVERSSRISRGMKLTRKHLLELALISSDNLATRTLAETYPGGYEQFISDMNATADEFGMLETRYDDSTGISGSNISSVDDIRKLATAASAFNIITVASNTVQYVIEGFYSTKNKPRTVKIQGNNTNFFAGKLDIVTAKTGFTSQAGKCLTMVFKHNGVNYLLVVMGAQTSEQRKQMVEILIDKIK